MRKLMWFTLGFSAACFLCAYLWLTEGLWIPALITASLFAGTWILSRKFKWIRCAAAVFLGCAAGFLWFQIYSGSYLSQVCLYDGQTRNISAYCTDYGYETDYGTAVEVITEISGKPVRMKVYLDETREIKPADLLSGEFRFRVTTPDGSSAPTAHQGRGIFLLAYQEGDVEIKLPQQRPAWIFAAQLRHRLLEILDFHFPEDTAAFAKALLLGDRTGIDYETNTSFKLSGISHIIAVSGLHVTILFTLISILCFKRRWMTALLGIPALVIFAAAAGFSPSITRACIMQCLMIAATVLNREYDGPTELAFSCMAMLLVNPLVITSVSFQLSVGCMIGIFLFSRRISAYLTEKYAKQKCRFRKIRQWIIGSVSVTLSAMVTTTPLVACYFGAISLVGILTNLLTLWVISFIFYGIMAVCILGMFWSAAAYAMAAVVAWPIRYVLTVSKLLAAFPLSAVYTSSLYVALWLVFCYILLTAFLLARTKKPLTLICCMIIGLCTSMIASWMETPSDEAVLTALDVGQGQCLLLQSEGKAFMVDCGGSDGETAADIAAEHLLARGIFRLDGLILTHFDMDHSSGAAYLLTRIPTDLLIVPDCRDEEGILQQLIPLVSEHIKVRDNISLSYGTSQFSIFGPVVPDFGNESSLAILFQRENCDILITGDRSGFGERVLLKTAKIPQVDILVAGHHGAKDASCKELLEAARPETVVISVGENFFGHPSKATLDRFSAIGAEVYRTDQHGTIILRR